MNETNEQPPALTPAPTPAMPSSASPNPLSPQPKRSYIWLVATIVIILVIIALVIVGLVIFAGSNTTLNTATTPFPTADTSTNTITTSPLPTADFTPAATIAPSASPLTSGTSNTDIQTDLNNTSLDNSDSDFNQLNTQSQQLN